VEALTIRRAVWVAAPPERVWSAITEPKQLEQWYAVGCPWEIPALQVGAQVRFYNTPADIVNATIEVVDPPRQFSLRWEPEPSGALLRTAFTLSAENGGTHVTISESGYEGLPASERQSRFDQVSEGYHMTMENLKAYLEGRPLPY
jgi:uncharacterized protein YndB with AHSA1/START domain